MKRHFALVALMATLSACNNTHNDTNGIEHIDIPTQTEETDTEAIDDLIRNARIVSLETNDTSLIDHISDITFSNDRIFVHDLGNMQYQVQAFDANGSWIAALHKGKGPNEILDPARICHNNVTNKLAILSQDNIMIFDKDLKPERSIPMDSVRYNDFTFHDGEYVLRGTHANNSFLTIADSNFELKKRIRHNPQFAQISSLFGVQNTKDGVLLLDFLSDTLSLYANGNLQHKYVIDYSNKIELQDNCNFIEAYNALMSHQGNVFIECIKQADDIQCVRVVGRSPAYTWTTFRNARTKKSITVRSEGEVLWEPLCSDGNLFVTPITYDLACDNIETLRKVLSPKDLKKVEAMNEDSNPLLLFYRIDI